jgi:hypothetical protein
MRKLATGNDVVAALRHLATGIESEMHQGLSPSVSKIADSLSAITAALPDHEDGRAFTAMANATVETFLEIMVSYLTQQDEKEDRKFPSSSRLALFLQALEEVRHEVRAYLKDDSAEAMAALKKSVAKNYVSNFPPSKKLFKQIDAWLTNQKIPTLNKI